MSLRLGMTAPLLVKNLPGKISLRGIVKLFCKPKFFSRCVKNVNYNILAISGVGVVAWIVS